MFAIVVQLKVVTSIHTDRLSIIEKAPYERRRKKAHIDIFYESKLNLTICLPPKCGTTNWQYALSTLNEGPNGRGMIPSLG